MLSSNSDIDISARQSLDFVANDIVIKAHTVRRKIFALITSSRFYWIRFVFRMNISILKNFDFLIVQKLRLLHVLLNPIQYASVKMD